MSRLGRAQRHLGRLAVPNLAGQNHVGILPQGVFQAVGERVHVQADFALRYDRTRHPWKEILDRLLHRHDSIAALADQQIDDHRQGGRLTRTGNAGDQYQSVAEVGKPSGQFFGKSGPVKIGDRRRNDPKTGSHLLAAQEVIRSISLSAIRQLQLHREVHVSVSSETLEGVLGTQRDEQLADLVRLHRSAFQLHEFAVQSHDGWITGDDVQIGSSLLYDGEQPTT